MKCRFFAALLCAGLSWSMPALALAAPPDPEPRPAKAKRKLAVGGTMIGLGFAAELTGSVISSTCETYGWCSTGFALTFGPPEGPTRYTLVSTGTSTAYVGGRIFSTPFLISGFTLLMVGIYESGPRASSWSLAQRRRVAWSLLGTGLGVLTVSRVLRMVFLATGTCQSSLCVHGLDQSSLWVGRGLTFAGAGILIEAGVSNRHVELSVGPGPAHSHGLSLLGRF
jgi:hypothetical protein